MKDKVRVCELCNKEARLYCDSDAAFLCFDCDFNVHNANFLVARHLRRLLCLNCNSLTGTPFSGNRFPHHRQRQVITCHSCSSLPEYVSGDKEIDSDSSACISSTTQSQTTAKIASTDISGEKLESPARFVPARVEGKAGGIFVNWCKRLGVNGDLVVPTAIQAMKLRRLGMVVLPLRVILAASFWFGLRRIVCGDRQFATWQNLKRLEEVSGVPAKLIVAVELKLEHALSRFNRRSSNSKRDRFEEGWAES